MLVFKLLPFNTPIFSSVLTSSISPDGWELSKIIPIPDSDNEYRPIAISSSLFVRYLKLLLHKEYLTRSTPVLLFVKVEI